MSIEELKKEISNSQSRIQNFIQQELMDFTGKTDTKISHVYVSINPLHQLGIANPINYIIHVSITPDLGF